MILTKMYMSKSKSIIPDVIVEHKYLDILNVAYQIIVAWSLLIQMLNYEM